MLSRRFQLSLNLFVAFCLAIQTSYPINLHAQKISPARQEKIQGAFDFQQLLTASEQMSVGQPRGTFAPDRFLLLEQQVHAQNFVGRSFSFFSNSVERDFDEHQSRLDRARRVQMQIERLLKGATSTVPCQVSPDVFNKELLEHINNGRAKDHPPIVWEARGNVDQLFCLHELITKTTASWEQQLVQLRAEKNTLTEVPNITQAPLKERDRWYNWWDVSVHVRDQDRDETLDIIKMQQSADRHSINDMASYSCRNGEACDFQLKKDGILLNSFHLPVKTMTTFGPYVVFAHQDSYDPETGTQHLSFIDLAQYGPALGKAEIPVFRLPIVTGEAITKLEVRNKRLILNGGKKLDVEAFMIGSELQQMAFNIVANLVDPKDIELVLPYIESLQTYFSKTMNSELMDKMNADQDTQGVQVLFKELGEQITTQISQNRRLNELTKDKGEIKLTKREIGVLSEDIKQVITTYGKGVESSKVLNRSLSRVSQRIATARGLKARVKMFFNHITSPQPNGSLKIKRALLMVGMSKNLKSGGFSSFLLDRPYLHSAVAAAAMMAAVSPDSFMQLVEGSLALGNGILDYLKFALYGLGEASVQGTLATISPVTEALYPVWKQYLADGNYIKTIIGVSALAPFILSFFYVPHLIFNLHGIYLDSKKPDWKGFVNHQRDFIRTYYERLADDEAKRRKLKSGTVAKVDFTSEEVAEIMAFVEKRKAESPAYQSPGFIGRSWNRTKSAFTSLKNKISRSKSVHDADDKEKIKGVWSALMSVTFSYPSMELTLGRWTRFWNWFAGARFTSIGFLTLRDMGLKYNLPVFIRLKPISAATRLIYPDFFTTVVAKRGPRLTIPTALNGGTRGWELRDAIWIKESILGKPSINRDAEEELGRELTRSELKVLTEDFEKNITEVEDAVFKAAFKASLRRLPEFIADKKQLQSLFTDKPLKSVAEKRVRELPVKVRTFLRLQFEEIYAVSMREVLKSELADAEAGVEAANELSLSEMKQRLLTIRTERRDLKPFQFDASLGVRQAEKAGLDDGLYERVAKQARKGEFSPKNWVMNRKYNLVGDMDPEQNGSMERFSTVQERMKSPSAFSRAVRAEISKLLITFPLDLAFKMFLSAGIFEGAFKPIQDELLGENSIFYFSRDSFYMTMAAGFAMSMMADAWIKIQQDARQDDMGDFGNIPKGEDAERSFFRWYLKQFNGKNNSLLGNWGFSNRIAFWNMPAALANISLFWYALSGRVDLSLLLAGYAISFGTPISAFYYKVDQAFERAVEYASRGIKDEKWMAHPAIQELIAKEKQYYRNRFQLLSDIYGNVQGNWLTNVEVIPTSYGTRGFARALFGGPLAEEAIVEKLLRPLDAMTKDIPVVGTIVDKVTSVCEHVLTNGNMDLTIKK